MSSVPGKTRSELFHRESDILRIERCHNQRLNVLICIADFPLIYPITAEIRPSFRLMSY
jgi:hypothetical protein